MLDVHLTVEFFCLILLFNSKGVMITLLGTCPYGNKGILPKNVTHISEDQVCAHFSIERDGFVENVQKTILSQPIHIILDVSNVKGSRMDGLRS